MKSRFLTIITLFLALGESPAHAAATLLPNGMQCFQATAGTNGMIGLLGTIAGGSGGTAGSYGGVALTGGSGSGATANITIAGGAVTAVTILNPGSAYVVGDVLSAASGSIGGTTGFSVSISSVAINSSLAGGKVFFYQPNTSTFKSTWFNADQAANHQNTNPVALDANGCATIYGTGSYRQVVQDALGNTVWDKATTDTSANNNTFWAGVAAGTPNVITVVDPGFNATDGSIINFTALGTNTSTATLNPSGFGLIPILKDTTAGPVSLIGGEIVQNNAISVIYRAVDNAFHLLNPPIQSASGSTAPLCGAVGLRITNSGQTAINFSADNVVMLAPNGAVINRSNVSFTINLQANGANGLDTGSIGALGAYNVWAIDNGAAPAGLASLSATAPTMPAGYTYKCRMAALPTDSSAHLFATITVGAETQLGQTDSFSTTNAAGDCVAGTVGAATFTALPPTAVAAIGRLDVLAGHRALIVRGVGGGIVAGMNPAAAGQTASVPYRVLMIAPQTINYCADTGFGALFMFGWVDKVNAH